MCHNAFSSRDYDNALSKSSLKIIVICKNKNGTQVVH